MAVFELERRICTDALGSLSIIFGVNIKASFIICERIAHSIKQSIFPLSVPMYV
jgi:hypothetical protein